LAGCRSGLTGYVEIDSKLVPQALVREVDYYCWFLFETALLDESADGG
jgi:hypothetical protein